MTQIKFDIIEWLSGLTNFIFDKAVLKRVAIECGVAEVKSYADIGEEELDRTARHRQPHQQVSTAHTLSLSGRRQSRLHHWSA